MQENGVVQTANDAAEVLYGTPDAVTLSDGSKVVVKKVTLRTLPGLVSYLQTVLNSLLVTDEQGFMVGTVDMKNPTTILNLIANHLQPTYAVVLSLTSLTEDRLLDMPLDDVLTTVQRLWELNADFFTQRIAPLLEKAESVVSESPEKV